jgi:hypothetical protein
MKNKVHSSPHVPNTSVYAMDWNFLYKMVIFCTSISVTSCFHVSTEVKPGRNTSTVDKALHHELISDIYRNYCLM